MRHATEAIVGDIHAGSAGGKENDNRQNPHRADCENEARTNLERWTATEKHMHQTDGLEVRWRCVPEQRDL